MDGTVGQARRVMLLIGRPHNKVKVKNIFEVVCVM